MQLPLLDGHSADGASGPSTHSLYHHGNKMVRVAQRTDSHEEEDLENNEDSATTDSSDTTDLNDVSSVWEGKGGEGEEFGDGAWLDINYCFSLFKSGTWQRNYLPKASVNLLEPNWFGNICTDRKQANNYM